MSVRGKDRAAWDTRDPNELGWHDDRGNLLRFLDDPGIEPTNNRAERALRGAVIARKVSHCSKNEDGADAFSVAAAGTGSAMRTRPPILRSRSRPRSSWSSRRRRRGIGASLHRGLARSWQSSRRPESCASSTTGYCRQAPIGESSSCYGESSSCYVFRPFQS